MELNKTDLIRLLSVLEGELQAREVVIAVLKAEQVKRLLYPLKRKPLGLVFPNGAGTTTIIPNKSGKKCSVSGPSAGGDEDNAAGSASDPYTALYRDCCSAFDPTFDELSTKSAFNLQLRQLDLLIDKYQKSRNFLKSKLCEINDKYNATFQELQIEKHKSAEYDRDTLLRTIDELQNDKNKLENQLEEIKAQFESEREREKKMIICLLTERKQLIVRLIEEKQKNTELLQLYNTEKNRISEMVEGLEEESKRSLQMELDLERLSGEYEAQKEQLREKLFASETRNAALMVEIERLRGELESKPRSSANPSVVLPDLGEGARSAIVTMNSSMAGHRVVSSVPAIATVSAPKVSVARPVSPSKPLANAAGSSHVQNVPAAPTLVRGSVKSANVPVVNTSSTYATVHPAAKQPFSAFVATSENSVPPSTPPKSAAVSKPVTSQTPSAPSFQNPTYSIESAIPPLPTSSPPVLPPVAKVAPVNAAKVVITAVNQLQTIQKKLPATMPINSNPIPRGAPPPVPPNKPVLPPQALKERSKELQAGAARAKLGSQSPAPSVVPKLISVTQPVVTGVAGSDAKAGEIVTKSCDQVLPDGLQNGSKVEEVNLDQTETDLVPETNNNSVDMLCQELADFQQLLVSMVANKNN